MEDDEAKIEYSPRQVIAGKLLAALDDDDKVAIVASQRDCELLDHALELAIWHSPSAGEQQELREFRRDLMKLAKAAFGR